MGLFPIGVQAAAYTGGQITNPDGETFVDGINLQNDMLIGTSLPEYMDPDTLYAPTVNPSFTLSSGADITVGKLLEIADGASLSLISSSGAAAPIDISVSTVSAGGFLNVTNIGAFNVTNSMTVGNGFALNTANSMTTGDVTVTGGDFTISKVNGMVQMAGFSNADTGTVDITAGSFTISDSDGSLSNAANSGSFSLTTTGTGNINVAGNITNAGSTMDLTAGGDIIVSGIVSNSADLIMNAVNLTMTGGLSNASVINSGDLTINVSGAATFSYGIDLTGMGETNSFYLQADSLVFGSDINEEGWLKTFSNKSNSFTLNITGNNGFVIKSDVVNGLINDLGGSDSYNTSANMSLTAQEFQADTIINYGTLSMESTAGDVVLEGINSYAVNDVNSVTTITASDMLQVNGNVSNGGIMTLSGATLDLDSVTNAGETLNIKGVTNPIGMISIAGNLTNTAGATYVNAKDISVVGMVATSNGTLTIEGSDTSGTDLSIGSINVTGGDFNLGALIGSVNVTGAVDIGLEENNVGIEGANFNIASSTNSLTAGGTINIDGDVNVGSTGETGGNLNIQGQQFTLSSGSNIDVSGTVNASQVGTTSYNIVFNAKDTMSFGNVIASGANNKLTFGTPGTNTLNVTNTLSASNGAVVSIGAVNANVGALNIGDKSTLLASGSQITATTGAIDIANGIWFNAGSPVPSNGLVISGTNELSLISNQGQVNVGGGIDVGEDNVLTLNAAKSNVTIGGIINSAGTLNIVTNGTSDVLPNVSMIEGLNVTSGGTVNISSAGNVNIVSSNVSVVGDVAQGTQTGSLNLISNNITFAGTSLSATGTYYANNGTALFELSDNINFSGGLTVLEGVSATFNSTNISTSAVNNSGLLTFNSDADYSEVISIANITNSGTLTMNAKTISGKNITNSGVLSMNTTSDINLASVNNSGTLDLDSGNGVINVADITAGSSGTINLEGNMLNASGTVATQNSNAFYQNYEGSLPEGSINVVSNNYTVNASQFNVGSIQQFDGEMVINANSVNIIGNVVAENLQFGKNNISNWANITIGGNVSSGVDFWGIKGLNIGGNYTFGNNSRLWAAVMPYDAYGADNTSNKNYWSTIEVTQDNSIGEITNADNGEALITIGNNFISDVTGIMNPADSVKPQIGITLFDTVDQGTAIWLLHAKNGIDITDEFTKLRNLDVQFCNADGTICIPYPQYVNNPNLDGYSTNLPIYISERDTDGDGVADSLYVVFDPNFGGPIEVFQLQPIVGAAVPHTEGEYVSAGALDDLIAGQLNNTKFYNDSPIEIIPQIFAGTNLSQMADELYDRMEYYNMNGNRDSLVKFSRLFQARELEQITAMVAMNEHTSFRDFEDRMFDEFIWNRNRNLKKAWLDADYGLFSQKETDGLHANGQRFSISGGFDWQHSETTIFGLTAHVSNSSGKVSDDIELGYLPGQSIIGSVDIKVDDLNIGFGGYMMKTLGEKTRLYGNAFVDMHMLDISRDQTYVSNIEGDGTSFSLISEWGLLHDWLNQYIVGNMYARVGYNFGFDIKEKAAGQDYMNLKSDGYLILTPGYSLIAQKRIYPSAWFQIRPYASIGVEYDVLGTPDDVKYKFALAHSYTDYDVDIDPLWANIGGGVEMLSANGMQVGIDYRYQYNDTIQLHNIKVSGSYRF